MSERNKEVEKFSSYSRPQQYWSPSTSLPRNPRIVRAPRETGGKDRHSKVCTLRGLRDRRIRLSLPTAIQLYDLQDRLGLPQPSKVVDWLLDAAKDDIDRLPPLPAIPSLLPDHGQPPPAAHEGNIGGFQKFFTAGGGQCVLLPHDSNGSGNNANSNYYSGNPDPAGLSLAMFGLGPQPAGEEQFLAFVSGTGSGSGSGSRPGSGPGPHHHLY